MILHLWEKWQSHILAMTDKLFIKASGVCAYCSYWKKSQFLFVDSIGMQVEIRQDCVQFTGEQSSSIKVILG